MKTSISENLEAFSKRVLEEQRLGEDAPRGYGILRSLLDKDFNQRVRSEESVEEYTQRALHGGRPPLRELLTSGDASILFPKVIQDMIREPREPIMIGQDVFCEPIALQSGQTQAEWYDTDAIVAEFVGEGEAAQDNNLGFARSMTTTNTKKAMVQLALSEEVVEGSAYDLIGLHLRAGQNALRRLKEQWIWNTAVNAAQVVFHNTNSAVAWKGSSTGVNSAGTANGTFTHLDFVDLIAGPIANGYAPDSILYHPVHWASFVKDPIIRDLMAYTWPVGASVPTQEGAMMSGLPFALRAYMTPFMASNVKTRTASTDTLRADILVCDSRESLILFTVQDPLLKEWTDPRVDVMRMNIRERYAPAVKNKGNGLAVAKDIVVDANWGPVRLQKTVS